MISRKTFFVAAIAALSAALLWCQPVSAAGPDASATISAVLSMNCLPQLCAATVTGYVAPTYTVLAPYEWNRTVQIQYFHQGLNQWLFCGNAFVPVMVVGSRIPITGQTSILFYKKQTYLFRLYAKVQWVGNGSIAQEVYSSPFTYTFPSN